MWVVGCHALTVEATGGPSRRADRTRADLGVTAAAIAWFAISFTLTSTFTGLTLAP